MVLTLSVPPRFGVAVPKSPLTGGIELPAPRFWGAPAGGSFDGAVPWNWAPHFRGLAPTFWGSGIPVALFFGRGS